RREPADRPVPRRDMPSGQAAITERSVTLLVIKLIIGLASSRRLVRAVDRTCLVHHVRVGLWKSRPRPCSGRLWGWPPTAQTIFRLLLRRILPPGRELLPAENPEYLVPSPRPAPAHPRRMSQA